MIEVTGDLWTYRCDALCIPVNWRTKRNGEAVMGAGVAKEAARRWVGLPSALGAIIRGHAQAVHAWNTGGNGPHVVAFPTKHDWREPSDLALMERMAPQLAWFASEYDWRVVALPRLGCGLGGRDWESEVKPILARYLDDRFVVVHPEATP